MSVALLWVVSPCDVSNGTSFMESVREGNRFFDSSRHRNLVSNERINRGGGKQTNNGRKFSVRSAILATPSGERTMTSEQMVYDVVLRQAALVKRQLRSTNELEVKPDIPIPGNLGLLSEAYDRCGEVCAEYAKTFNLGTMLMTPERRRAIWAIYVWCRRTDELVDGPNASYITPAALDRWENRLEDVFNGRPFDMLDGALSDTVSNFPVDIQPFRDMIEGMRMDLRKSRYKNFAEIGRAHV